MKINCLTTLIFDLDGTLCTYGITLEDSLEKCFAEDNEHIEPFSAEEYEEEFKREFDKAVENRIDLPDLSFRQRVFWNLLVGTNTLEEAEPSLRKQALNVAQRFDEIREGSLHLFPEVGEVIPRLKEKYKLGLLTNGPSELQRSKIEQLGIESWFDSIVVSGEQSTAKPDPKIFEIVLKSLNSKPENTMYVGNSLKYDVLGANRAGIPVVWRKNDEEEELKDANPNLTVNDLTELADGAVQIEWEQGTRRIKL